MKYYKNGNLRSFMIKNQKKFVNLVETQKLDLQETGPYLGQESASTSGDEIVKFSTKDLIQWSEGIADGMEYLAEKHVSISKQFAFPFTTYFFTNSSYF